MVGFSEFGYKKDRVAKNLGHQMSENMFSTRKPTKKSAFSVVWASNKQRIFAFFGQYISFETNRESLT